DLSTSDPSHGSVWSAVCDPTFQEDVESALTRRSHPFPGGHSGVVPPDPIPNSEVKRACADGSVALPCKSRSPPGALSQKPPPATVGVFSLAPLRWRPQLATRNRSPPESKGTIASGLAVLDRL